MSDARPTVLAITGASGALYAVHLLRSIARLRFPVWLIVSEHGFRLLQTEVGIGDIAALRQYAGAEAWDAYVRVFDDGDRGALPASGSVPTSGMVICPCSMGTIAAVAHGTSRSLVERAADVTLKERRRLIVVPRETPYSQVHLDNMLRLTMAGGTVLPASPGFYHQPQSIEDLVAFVVGRILDHLDIKHELVKRWGGDPRAST